VRFHGLDLKYAREKRSSDAIQVLLFTDKDKIK